MAKKEKVNVERIGKNTGRPITSAPVPVRETMIGSNAPYYIDSNGTIIESVVDNDGVNTQTFYRSNLVPSFKLKIRHDGVNAPDTLGVYNYTDPQSFIAYDKLKPGSKEYTEVVKKSKQYNVPLATYNEASANFEEVKNQAQHLQPGGSIARRLLNKWTGKDKYEDGYGAPRSHTSVRESAHRTALKAADSPLVQAIPVVGDIADGYVAADYAAKGNYKPAMAAIGAGLILPNALESGARYIPKDTWRDALKKLDDVDLNSNITRELPDDVKKHLDDVKSGKVKLTKDISELTDNEKELLLKNLQRGPHRVPSQRIDLGPVDHDIDKVWIPENPNIVGKTDVGNAAVSKSVEPWWGWDPVEYQKGGNLPTDDQQQQLFVAIITDMAATLGVEPSQEFAEAILTAFEKQDDSQGLITLFTKTKDKFMNETGLFREGGKMFAFVEKFKCGGKKTKVQKTKVQKAALGDQIGDKISKVSRSTMFDDAKEFMPEADRKFVRGAYRTAKNHGRDLGLTGRGLRNWAKGQVSDRFREYADEPVAQQVPQAQQLPQLPVLSDIVIEDEPIVFDDPFKSIDFSTPVVKRMETRPKWTATNASVGQGTNTYTVQRGNTLGQIVADYNKNNPGSNLKWQDVAAWNGISDPSKMQVGQVINFTKPNTNTNTNTNAEDAYWTPGYQVVSRQDGSLGTVRSQPRTSSSTAATQTKPEKKNSWFANATMGAAMADAPAVMTASGWRRNEAGDYVQDREDDPGVARLRDNLAVLGGVAQGVTGAGLLSSATGAGTGTLAIAGPTIEAPATTPLLTGPAAKHFLYDAAGKLVMAYKRGGILNKYKKK